MLVDGEIGGLCLFSSPVIANQGSRDPRNCQCGRTTGTKSAAMQRLHRPIAKRYFRPHAVARARRVHRPRHPHSCPQAALRARLGARDQARRLSSKHVTAACWSQRRVVRRETSFSIGLCWRKRDLFPEGIGGSDRDWFDCRQRRVRV
jgi:hypothetical protein